MKRIPKLWTGLGVAAIAGSMAAQADVITLQKGASQSPIILAQEAGEGGEGGGEGGGAAPTTYALESTDPNAFNYDAKPQIDAYIDLVATSYMKAADDARLLSRAVDTFLAAPSDDTLKAARRAWVEAHAATTNRRRELAENRLRGWFKPPFEVEIT